MKHTYIYIALIFFSLATYKRAQAQAQLAPLSTEYNTKAGRLIYQAGKPQSHSAIQPYIQADFADSAQIDSLWQPFAQKSWQSQNWVLRKIFNQHLIEKKGDGFQINADFLPDMQMGQENGRSIWLNTRGAQVEATVGKQFYLRTYFYENQARTPQYLTDFVNDSKVFPGQAYTKFPKPGVFDFAYSGATLSYTPSKYVNFQLGYDKNFIGDGYRSLLLSNNATNYPFAKITATLGNIRYMTMWTQMLDMSNYNGYQDIAFNKKYGVFQYFDWNITSRLALGFFQNIMWKPRGFEFSYVIPIAFVRPIENANGSPDKVTLGLNASYKIADRYVAYGQLVINEFTAKEVFANTGYWANKQGGQIGIKGFDVFHIDRLNLLLEANIVRPYTYSAIETIKNYGHANQPLAHPFGGNFREIVGIANYTWKRLNFNAKLNGAYYGLDKGGKNYGKDIYEPYTTRVEDYGNYIGNGVPTKFVFAELKTGYLLNPKNNLRIEFALSHRKESNVDFNHSSTFYTLGLRSSFRSFYTDF